MITPYCCTAAKQARQYDFCTWRGVMIDARILASSQRETSLRIRRAFGGGGPRLRSIKRTNQSIVRLQTWQWILLAPYKWATSQKAHGLLYMQHAYLSFLTPSISNIHAQLSCRVPLTGRFCRSSSTSSNRSFLCRKSSTCWRFLNFCVTISPFDLFKKV